MVKIFIIVACANGVCFPSTRTFETVEACQAVAEDMLSTLAANPPEGLDPKSLSAKCVEEVQNG